MFNKPILIYSNYCKYSHHFLDTLSKTPLADDFQYINIDYNPNTKTRSDDYFTVKNILSQHFSYTLKSVPTIVVENGEFILNGKDTFEWLNYKLNTLHNSNTANIANIANTENTDQVKKVTKENSENENVDPSGFNLHEMGSFSDSYSTYGLNSDDTCTDAKSQCFQFLDGSFDNESKLVRFNENEKTVSSKPNTFKKNKSSPKEDELNSRYEELMMERKAMDKTIKAPDRF